MGRREVVTKALERLGKASPKEILGVAVQIDPSITIQDINFELYHGSRDPNNPVYKKLGKGKYSLLKKGSKGTLFR